MVLAQLKFWFRLLVGRSACRLFLISITNAHLYLVYYNSQFRTDSRTLLFFSSRHLFTVSLAHSNTHWIGYVFLFTFKQSLHWCSTAANNCPLHSVRAIDDRQTIQFTPMVAINIIPFNDWNVSDNLRRQLCGMCSASFVSQLAAQKWRKKTCRYLWFQWDSCYRFGIFCVNGSACYGRRAYDRIEH